jgi:hypothetical protein
MKLIKTSSGLKKGSSVLSGVKWSVVRTLRAWGWESLETKGGGAGQSKGLGRGLRAGVVIAFRNARCSEAHGLFVLGEASLGHFEHIRERHSACPVMCGAEVERGVLLAGAALGL